MRIFREFTGRGIRVLWPTSTPDTEGNGEVRPGVNPKTMSLAIPNLARLGRTDWAGAVGTDREFFLRCHQILPALCAVRSGCR